MEILIPDLKVMLRGHHGRIADPGTYHMERKAFL